MFEKLDHCPLCKHTRLENHLICEDHLVSHESFVLVKCANCGFIFTNPRPTESALGKYYESEQYISHANKGNSLINILYKCVRFFTLRSKINLVKHYSHGSKLLDYGCGTGDFLQLCQSKGFHIYGVEPHAEARNIAARTTSKPIESRVKKLKEKVHVITAWHVVEHISELKKTLKSLKKLLIEDGVFIIAVPNHQSYDARYYQEHWAAYDVPRHLYHFDKTSMQKLASILKMRIIETKPMKYDSFYVSMLSEKNRGTNNLWNAFRVGLKSNRLAKNSGEYSSLIYILQK